MVVSAGGLQVHNEVENSKLETKSLEVVAQIEEIFDEYLADENVERVDRVEIDNTTYIGVLTIPCLNNMSLGVIDRYTDENLKVSICRYSGGIGKSKMVIAGHNYKYSFGQLSKMKVGSIAYFKTLEGVTYQYRCTEILELSPKDVDKMQEGNWDMTLFTCTYDGRNRLTLRFELENEV